MRGIVQSSLPAAEPVLLADAKAFARVTISTDDALITALITAARAYVEDCTNLVLAQRNFVQYMDAFPFLNNLPYGLGAFFPQPAYFGYNGYPYPVAGFNTRRNPFDIYLMASPLIDVDHIRYLDTTGNEQTLQPDTDFIVDRANARISPLPGKQWPSSSYSQNSVAIYFTAGFDPNPSAIQDVTEDDAPTPPQQQTDFSAVTGIPQPLRVAILMLVNHWYFKREPWTDSRISTIPHSIDQLIQTSKTTNVFTAEDH